RLRGRTNRPLRGRDQARGRDRRPRAPAGLLPPDLARARGAGARQAGRTGRAGPLRPPAGRPLLLEASARGAPAPPAAPAAAGPSSLLSLRARFAAAVRFD